MAYFIFDEETETHKSRKRKANPFDERNYIVMRGWKKEGDTRASMEYFASKAEVYPMRIPDDVDILVGHNIKFDLLYEMCIPGGYDNIAAFIRRGGKIWCTQYAEYLIRAQHPDYHMVAMDSIIESYGGRKKIDGLKELWKAGIKTSEINRDLLEDYLIGTEEEKRNSGDIGNTELIYLGQLEEALSKEMLTMIEVRMDGLLATTECEYNGLRIDPQVAKENMTVLQTEQALIAERLREYTAFIPDEVSFSWGNTRHVSCLLFGGTIKYELQRPYLDDDGQWARTKATARWPLFGGVPVDPAKCSGDPVFGSSGQCYYGQDEYVSGKKKGTGKFKNVDVPGEIKIKWQDYFFKCPGITAPDKKWKTSNLDGMGGPIYQTGADIIEELGKRNIPFLKDLSRNSALTKELGTYYCRYDEKKKTHVGMLTCVDPQTKIVHHSLNHVNTVTSRLSSSEPNMQNIPRADKSVIKKMFVSRFGPTGVMVEIDYSQLEVVVQGLLSLDKSLVNDLLNKVDFHCKRVALKNGIAYTDALYWCKDESYHEYKKWKEERTKAKNFSFQRAYGAGAQAIADSTGIDVEEVKAMIIAEEKEYSGVVKFNDAVAAEVMDTATPFRDKDRGWNVYRRGYYRAPTGTMYTFRSYDAPEWMKKSGSTDTFMPTEMKNYPIQGTGGEIVQMVLGQIFRAFNRLNNFNGTALLVNTVHDCYWFDCIDMDTAIRVKNLAMAIMTAVPQLLKKYFNIDCPVPFPAEAECGPNMYDLKHFPH